MYFPHDLDAEFGSFDFDKNIVSNGDLLQLLNAAPGNRHIYYGHVYDIVANTYNAGYMQHWTDNYQMLLPDQDWSTWLSEIGARANHVLGQVNSAIAPINFAITTNGGANFSTTDFQRSSIDSEDSRLESSSITSGKCCSRFLCTVKIIVKVYY